MQTKLTLRIDEALIKKAKRYSQEKLPPTTRKLKGALKAKQTITKEDYYKYLEDKYL